MFYLRNLCSTEIFADVKPWEFSEISSVPKECFSNKTARDVWINNPATQFHCYSLYEGLSRLQRLRTDKGEEEGNPPFLMHGLAVDYDLPTTVEGVQKVCGKGVLAPQWFEQTLSGNGRALWVFEKPISLPSRSFLCALLDKIGTLIPFQKVPGFDRQALLTPERYYTNGCRWTALNPAPVPAALLQGFVLKVSSKFDWQRREFGKAISLEAIGSECRKKFPRFSEWSADFEVGASGPTFWIEGSTSPKSAIVRETGLQTFAAHASKTFYPWAEIVGAQFVNNTELITFGKAVEDIYYDGKSFFFRTPTEKFVADSRENVALVLRAGRGLSPYAGKGEISPVDQALHYIITHNRIAGASPCAFYPKGLFNFNGARILNMHDADALAPAEEATAWGSEGNFPFLSAFFDSFFNPKEIQTERFLAWLQYFYRACVKREPCSGHGVFLCGPVGCGKTMLSRGVIHRMVGGCADAAQYLTNADTFNSELFDFALWVIDDGSIACGEYAHRHFSENIKRYVANREHRVNEKFRKAVLAPWQGRIVASCNDDPESMRLIPNLDISVREKLLLFKVQAPALPFPPQDEFRELLDRETPYFCRWLLDWSPPAHCYEGAEARFGINSYCEPSLALVSNHSSPANSFAEALLIWLTEYFRNDPTVQSWHGSATELRMAMSVNPAFHDILRTYKIDALPRLLVQLQTRGMLQINHTSTALGRIFTITRNGQFSGKRSQPAQTPNSQFAKYV